MFLYINDIKAAAWRDDRISEKLHKILRVILIFKENL